MNGCISVIYLIYIYIWTMNILWSQTVAKNVQINLFDMLKTWIFACVYTRVCVCVCVCVCARARARAGTVFEPVSIMVWLFKLLFQCEIRELHNTCSEVQKSVTECFLLVSCWAVNNKNRSYFTVNLPLLSTVCFCSWYSLYWLLDPNGAHLQNSQY
jgi:hypothetical protein